MLWCHSPTLTLHVHCRAASTGGNSSTRFHAHRRRTCQLPGVWHRDPGARPDPEIAHTHKEELRFVFSIVSRIRLAVTLLDNAKNHEVLDFVGRGGQLRVSQIPDQGGQSGLLLARHPPGQRRWHRQLCVRDPQGHKGQDGSRNSELSSLIFQTGNAELLWKQKTIISNQRWKSEKSGSSGDVAYGTLAPFFWFSEA